MGSVSEALKPKVETINQLVAWLKPDLPPAEGDDYVRGLTESLKIYFERSRVVASEDLVNETWAIVLRQINSGDLSQKDFASDDARRGYVFGVAKNLLREWVKKQGRRKEDPLQDGSDGPSVPPLEGAPVDCQKLLTELVDGVLDRLRSADRDIIQTAVLVDGPRRLEETATAMSISYDALRKRVSRAMARFKTAVVTSEPLSKQLQSALSCLGWVSE